MFDLKAVKWGKQGRIKELREYIKREWDIKLMKDPRWLGKWQQPLLKASVVIHIANTEERQEIMNRNRSTLTMEAGKLTPRTLPKMRPFRQVAAILEKRYESHKTRNKKCGPCIKEGHLWWGCPEANKRANHKCGLCSMMGHTTY